MERYKRIFKEEFNITSEMKDAFVDRTKNHLQLVQKYANILADELENKTGRNFSDLRTNSKHHDESKFVDPELTPYILVNWNYKCKDEGISLNLSQEDFDNMNKATEHHVKTNKHHPEYWSDRTDVIPKSDRDKFDPSAMETIQINHMPFISLCEMVADWCAMSEERGNTPREWADKVVGIRWGFSDKQTKQIYKLIDLAWGK